ncbi:reverse transcriptase domain-containing protein [Tanacetum coccineum]
MHGDARKLIRPCQDCQVHKPVLRNPQQKLSLITSPWSFYKWGIDIAGPFPEGPGKVKFLIVGRKEQNWMEELPHVLWAHRTMIKSSNGDTPFSLTYGTKAVIPAEIGMPTLRIVDVDLVQNDEALEINLDLLEDEESKQHFEYASRNSKDG